MGSKASATFFQRGTSLIRLLIFLVVFAACITILFYSLNITDIFAKMRDNQRKADLLLIKNAFTVYYKSNGRYPPNPKSGDYRIFGSDAAPISWGDAWPPYMNIVPKDPQYADRSYIYVSPDSHGQTYYIYASLERGADVDVCKNGCLHVPADVLCGTAAICNFGLTSDNTTP